MASESDAIAREPWKDDWDFYPCRVDDAPGSIFLNLALKHHRKDLPENTLYAIQIQMLQDATHGMGTSEEADALYPVEDALVAALSALKVRFIGRLRNLGVWQLTFMGPANLESDIEQLARTHLQRLPRQFSIIMKADPNWDYYSDFLFPNQERMRWIQDRRVVEVLQREGDLLTLCRRVDHWIYFTDLESRAAFAAVVVQHGFQPLEGAEDATDLGLQVYRVDSVQLDDIHQVTNLLTDLAERFNGNYDGWETSVEAQ